MPVQMVLCLFIILCVGDYFQMKNESCIFVSRKPCLKYVSKWLLNWPLGVANMDCSLKKHLSYYQFLSFYGILYLIF